MPKSGRGRGLYEKYVITRRDGVPLHPEAEYFVLRIDNDSAARVALRVYAKQIKLDNEELAKDLEDWVGLFTK